MKAGENCKSKPSADCIVIFTRGLSTHRYFCVALRGFFIRKDDFLVVQAQEEVDQEVNHPIS
ncbi:MAG TPA: hypothetical protein PKM71_06720, partial [Candidatus Cloacimonas sp.]|nr:hypothetical protein [Candidatus Cloacimonas sp.]